jgi:alpha-1,2-mannosyltransferase
VRANRHRGAGYAAGAALAYLLFTVVPIGTLFGNAYAFGLILLVNALPWRHGAAPAFPINRWFRPVRRTVAIPPARRPTGS